MFYCMPHKLNNYIKYEKDKKSIACPICVHRVEYKASLLYHRTEHNTLWPFSKIYDYKILIQKYIKYKWGHVEYINSVIMFFISFLHTLLYNKLNTYCFNILLYGCPSPQKQGVQTVGTVFHINAMICLSVLCKWYRICLKCRCLLSHGCGSLHVQEASHRCYLFVYSTVMLCYTGAFRPGFIISSIYIKYISDLVHTCIHCIIDMNYEQNDGGSPLMSVFHLDRGFTSLGYNLFHHL